MKKYSDIIREIADKLDSGKWSIPLLLSVIYDLTKVSNSLLHEVQQMYGKSAAASVKEQ